MIAAAADPNVTVAVVTGIASVASASVSAMFAFRASRNSKPVANGFTQHVRDELRYLRERQDAHLDLHHAK